ncbi:MAG: exonuclease [Comamonadaceae bacterium]|nr:exonuclease [Comamonadaceae bacterium]
MLDADIIAFQLAATSQKAFAFPGLEKPAVDLADWAEVVPRIDAEVAKLVERTKADAVIVCLSCPTVENWRLGVLPSYKGNRSYEGRPEYLQRIKDYLEAEYPSYRRDTLEADDIMGILSTHPTLVKGRKVIVSEDKDMKTIPGWLFNPAKDTKPRLISEEEADRWHLYQAIVGDSTDGYAGCPGAGPDKAGPVLDGLRWESYLWTLKSGPRKGETETRWRHAESPGTAWQRVVSLYEKHGFTEQDALVQARVSRICRASDYDFKNKEVILWTPSN